MRIVYIDDDDARRGDVEAEFRHSRLAAARKQHASFDSTLVFVHANNDDASPASLADFATSVFEDGGRVIFFSGGALNVDVAVAALRAAGAVPGRDFVILPRCDIASLPWKRLLDRPWSSAGLIQEWLADAQSSMTALYILCLAYLSLHPTEAKALLGDRARALIQAGGVARLDQWRETLGNTKWWHDIIRPDSAVPPDGPIGVLLHDISKEQPLRVDRVASALLALEESIS